MKKAVEFVRYMVDTYGVSSFFDNLNDEYTLEDAIAENDIWYESPCCQELILFEDYPEAFEVGCICPICEEPFEEDI